MRTVLTLIAVALVAALSAALVAPHFIDWSAQRGFIESRLAERLGVPVSITGKISVRLLPTPYLATGEVRIGAPSPRGERALVAEAMRIELNIAGLTSDRVEISEVALDRPIVALSEAADHLSAGLTAGLAGFARRAALDRLVISKGRLNVASVGGAPLALTDIDIDVSAKSPAGPFRGSGAASTPQGTRAQLQFVSMAIADAALPVKGEIDWGPGRPRLAFDGKLRFASDPTASPRFEPSFAGAITLTGTAPALEVDTATPWRVSGALSADRHHAALDALEMRLGPDERALEASGSARADFDSDFFLAAGLSSKQLNVDSFLRRQGEDSAPPARLVEALKKFSESIAGASGLPVQFRLEFSTPSAFLGAQTLDSVSLGLASKPGSPLTVSFGAGLPGQGHLRLSGELETGAAAEFRGQMQAHVGDFAALRDWATQGEPEIAARFAGLGDALRYSDATASADLEASTVGFSARNLNLTIDRSTLTGALACTMPLAGERGRLFLDLRSEALDIDSAPNFVASADWLSDFDLSLGLEAAKLRIARVGDSTLESGSLKVKATRTGTKFALNRLTLADLGGATIEAEAEATPAGRWARLRLDAAHLRDFAALVARVAPGHYSRMFADRADALSPAKATLEARRDGPALEGPFPLDFLRADGEAGQSRFTVKLSNAPAPVAATVADISLDAPDGAALLRQLGDKPPAQSVGRAHIAVSASGRWETGFDARVTAALAGADLTWRGRFLPEPISPDDFRLSGSATLKSDNLLPLLALFSLSAQNAGVSAPVDLSADFLLHGAEASLPRLAGTVAGANVAGSLAWRLPVAPVDEAVAGADVAITEAVVGEAPLASPTQISGQISVDRATMAGLLALPLGASAPAKSGLRWSDAPFAPPLLRPPPADVRLKIAAFDLGDGLPARGFDARLRLDPAKFDLEEFAFDVAGGHASGRLTIRRDGPVVALNGDIALASIGVDRPAARGRVSTSLSIAGTGQNPKALVAGLVGEGRVSLAQATIARLDPGALSRVIAKAQMPEASIDETNIAHSFALELDKQPLAIPETATAATLRSGVVRFGPIEIAEPGGRTTTLAEFDLRSLDLQIRTVFEQARAGKFWSDSPPNATVTVRGVLDAPTRQIEVASLVAGLATQAIARESDRIAILEADLRERAFFNRVLRAERFLGRRAAEIAAYEEEQARLKSEAERKRTEETLLKAYEDRAKAAAPFPLPAADAPTPADGSKSMTSPDSDGKPRTSEAKSPEPKAPSKAAVSKAAGPKTSDPEAVDPTRSGLY